MEDIVIKISTASDNLPEVIKINGQTFKVTK